MNTQQAEQRLTEQRERLVSLKEERHQAADLDDDQRGATGELSGDDQHPGDVATETFERTRELSIIDQVDERIAEVDAAMARIEDGTYGECEVCGREINPERLDLRPEARYCMEHQSEVERGRIAERNAADQESIRWD